MAEHPNHLEEVGRLAGLLLEGALGPAERRRLEELLLADPAALEYYSDYVDVHCLLHWQHGQTESEQRAEGGGQRSETADQQSTSDNQQSFVPPIILDLSPGPRSPLFTLHSSVGGFLFSYTAAALLLGLALSVGWSWKVRNDSRSTQHVARQDSIGDLPKASVVGRITGVVDCRWADPAMIVFKHDGVALGQEYVLQSGFLEITYDSGAKVILQGPAKYQVESASGGFLALGKLTARVETKTQDLSPKSEAPGSKGERTANLALSQQEREPTTSLAPRLLLGRRRASSVERREQSVNQKSHSRLSTLDSRLFSVRTPTAIVTDLGTEFGVEVERSGVTRSHVFQGKVELRVINLSGEQDAKTIPLSVNQSVTVAAGSSKRVEVVHNAGPAIASAFARQLPRPSDDRARHLGDVSRGRTPAAKPSYRFTDLGTLGGNTSYAFGLNDRGQVAGHATIASGAPHAFLYSDGKMRDLGTLGGSTSYAFRVNDRGQVVGKAGTNARVMHAFLYDHGTMNDLGTLGGTASSATSINDRGQVVGKADTANGVEHAFLYSGGVMKDLGAFGGKSSSANGINVHGQVVGCSFDENGFPRAFLYSGGGFTSLGTLGGKGSVAMHISDAGHVVGHSTIAGDEIGHAFLGVDGKLKDLGALHGGNSEAFCVNDIGQVVGRDDPRSDVATISRFTHACLYDVRQEKMIDLNSLVDSTAGWVLVHATGVNNSGQIAGYGTAPDGNTRAFLLTPIVVQASRLHHKPAGETPAPQGDSR